MSAQLSLNAREEICLSGRIDLNNVKDLCLQGLELIDRMSTVRVNLAAVTQVDSSSLAMLIDWIRKARTQHKDIVLINMPQTMLDLGRVCGLDTILPIDKPLKWQ